MKRQVLSCALLLSAFPALETPAAVMHATGAFDVLAAASDGSSIRTTRSGFTSVQGDFIVSDASSAGFAEAAARGYIRGFDMGLAMHASVTNSEFGLVQADAVAILTWSDRLTLVGDEDLPSTEVDLTWAVSGDASASGINFLFFDGGSASAGLTAYSGSRAFAGDSFSEGTWNNVPVTGTLDLGDDRSAAYTVQLGGSAFAKYESSGTAFGVLNFANTVTFDAITFSDGSTPEDHGFTVQFDSGLDSPNLADTTTIPEPGSVLIWSMLSLVTLTVGAECVRRKHLPQHNAVA